MPQSASKIVPYFLRVEYLRNPIGLDDAQPRLSWKVRAVDELSRGNRQTSYQIRVASQEHLLRNGTADLWDSNETPSSETAHIHYVGPTLRSQMRCWWNVRVRDQDGVWSGWSEPSNWSMGLLEPGAWKAKWIGTDESFSQAAHSGRPDRVAPPDNTVADPWICRNFYLREMPRQAIAFIASVGFHELFINGHKVGDAVLAPSVTDNSKRARYVSYDITGLLTTGENAIGLWLGVGWSIYKPFETADKPRSPIAIGHFEFEMHDGTRSCIGTDTSWRTFPSPSRTLGIWDFMNFGGEHYDANRELPGWSTAEFDRSAWKQATAYAPNLILSAERVEPNRLLTELSPVAILEPEAGVFRIDMGRNFSGWLEVKIQANPCGRVDLSFSERPDCEITHRIHSAYVAGPSGKGTFKNRFNYNTGRWVTIRGLSAKPALDDIRGWQIRNDLERASGFTCASALLNEIHSTALWTTENLSLGGYFVDCPHRERMGYGGDAQATISTALFSFGAGAFFGKWSEDWRDTLGQAPRWGFGHPVGTAGGGGPERGNLPYTAPTYWGGGGPAWSGFCLRLPWELYRHYGDVRILECNFTMISEWLEYLETKAINNRLMPWGGRWDFLGDWLWPGSLGAPEDGTSEAVFFNNCFWIYSLHLAAEIADMIGMPERSNSWRKRASDVRQSVHSEFFNPGDSSYANGSQTCLSIALLAEVPPSDMRLGVLQRLEREITEADRGHINAGILGGTFLFKALLEAGRSDLVYTMVSQVTQPSWGHMLRSGATTFWEAWNDHSRHSLLHSSFLFVGSWFIEGILGIRPLPGHAGFGQFEIRPDVVEMPGMPWAKGHYESIHGRISSSWRRTDEGFEITIEVPANTRAFLHIPAEDAARVYEGNLRLQDCSCVRNLGLKDGRLVVAVESGIYHFSSILHLRAAGRSPGASMIAPYSAFIATSPDGTEV